MTDAELAHDLAYRAGQLLLELSASSPLSGKALGDAGDAAANRLICEALSRARPNDGLLSEEKLDDRTRLEKSRVWIVDPLDGTREYAERSNDWAVHIGLSIDGVAAVGAVALPALGQVLASDAPPPRLEPQQPLRMLISRTRPAHEAVCVAEQLGAELIPMGSAGAKAMAVIRGEADVYLHSGGQFEWDNCAPAAVALASGFHASRIDGSPLIYNRPDVSLPDLLICHPDLAPTILAAIANVAAP